MSSFLLAAAQFPVFEPRSFEEYADVLRAWVGEARDAGAELLTFPEYASLVLVSLFPEEVRSDLATQVLAWQNLRNDYTQLHRQLAQEHQLFILAGSAPWRLETGRIVNRAWFFAPDGSASFQDKCVMTRFERESWGISSGEGLRVFDTKLGRVGVDICYDSEFPLLARAQAEAGALVLLVPSCTDTRAGYERVRIGCQARALEGQFYVAQAPLVGELNGAPAIDVNVGRAGIFGPPDEGFPENGVVALGDFDQPGWVYAPIEALAVQRARRDGQVRPFEHWPEQGGLLQLPPVEVVHLGQ